jgi:hypothetical protein
MSTKKAVTKTTGPIATKGVMIPKNLAELRTKFDGLKDIAAKFEDGSVKTQLMNGVEELYLGAAHWFAKGYSNVNA